MRLVGLDIGEKRVGVALSDERMRVATPHSVLTGDLAADLRPLRRILEDYEAGALVVGLPLTLAGDEGPQADRIRSLAERIGRELGIRVVFRDERLSSAEANAMMRDSGLSERERRGSVDMVAAALILQGYLDAGGPAQDGIGPDD